ncbi:MAG: hypothetical protein J6M30_02955 [Bacteroidales bacterium]|nr:hypothetical protein [Bacteroidales bacterium]
MIRNLFTAIILVICLFSQAVCQKKLTTVLVDDKTKQPVAFASVSLSPNSVSGVMSDDSGRVALTYRSDKDTLYIMHISYQMKTIAVKDVKKQVKLKALQTDLDTVNVHAMGAKTLLIEALKKVKQNYYTEDYLNDIDFYGMKSVDKDVVSLVYNNSLWGKITALFFPVFVPKYPNYTLNEENHGKNTFKFSFNDLTSYYTMMVYYSNLYRKEKQRSTDRFAMKIIKTDSVETGYVIIQTPVDTAAKERTYTSFFRYPVQIRYYINADNLAIEKIEARSLQAGGSVVTKDFSYRLQSAVTVLNFRPYKEKYFLANCFSKVSYYEGTQGKSLTEEKILFDTKSCYLNGKPKRQEAKTEEKPLQELMLDSRFEFIQGK